MRSGAIYVAKTVLLETEWVLRFAYGFDRNAIHGALSRLIGLKMLTIEDTPIVNKAVAWYEAGMDFADALHLASSPREASEFATFDRRLAVHAPKLDGTIKVRLLPNSVE